MQSRFQTMSESIISKNILLLSNFKFSIELLWDTGKTSQSCVEVSMLSKATENRLIWLLSSQGMLNNCCQVHVFAPCLVLTTNMDKFICFLDYYALDEMGSRIDELEQSINELRTEMGQDGSPSPSSALKPKEEPKAADDSA
ncbi:heat shock factor binding protein [Actinidia rufa]|uniref:Heat shock factor binding protein n=1 Tax=Actinidia rufa TaxID=165716 RepID=A0A7J0HFB3_9ERIC|nr:heat shock factor binding protein [Actinidia rufa]